MNRKHTLSENRKLQLHYIFQAYALARKAARAGYLDEGRLNKALGILQSRVYHTSTGEPYEATTTSCTCKDWQYRTAGKRQDRSGRHYTGPCKHILAEMLRVRMTDLIMADVALIGQDLRVVFNQPA